MDIIITRLIKNTSLERKYKLMMISVSLGGNAKEPHKHVKFERQSLTGKHLEHALTNYIWSPILWNNNYRKNANFQQATAIALDFDNGDFTLDDAIEFLEDTKIKGIIGTTKSHRIEKKTPLGVITQAYDRFRMILAIETPITDPFTYTQQMIHMSNMFPIDKSCKDRARFFYPCKEIIYYKGEKNLVLMKKEHIETLKQQHKKKVKQEDKIRLEYKAQGLLPSNITMPLAYGVAAGKRHHTAYRLAAELTKFGWSYTEIEEKLNHTNIADIGNEELRRCIENGQEAAKQI